MQDNKAAIEGDTNLKHKFYVVKDHNDDVEIWSKEHHEIYIRGCVRVGGGSAYKIVIGFNGDENYLFPSPVQGIKGLTEIEIEAMNEKIRELVEATLIIGVRRAIDVDHDRAKEIISQHIDNLTDRFAILFSESNVNQFVQGISKEGEEQKLFTLKEALEIWNAGYDRAWDVTKGQKDGRTDGTPSITEYFKQKFGIDINQQ